MFTFDFFRNVACNCKWGTQTKSDDGNSSEGGDAVSTLLSEGMSGLKKQKMKAETIQALQTVASKHSIVILPVWVDDDIDDTNLYPETNHVETWNIFVVGSDKTYILSYVQNPLTQVPNHEMLLNHKSDNIIPGEMQEFFDAVWDQTLMTNSLQLYVSWNGYMFQVNTYPLINELQVVVGAVMFMRSFNHMNFAQNKVTLENMMRTEGTKQRVK